MQKIFVGKKKRFGVILTKLMNKKVQKKIAQTYVN